MLSVATNANLPVYTPPLHYTVTAEAPTGKATARGLDATITTEEVPDVYLAMAPGQS